jgi:hypothetical protein
LLRSQPEGVGRAITSRIVRWASTQSRAKFADLQLVHRHRRLSTAAPQQEAHNDSVVNSVTAAQHTAKKNLENVTDSN